MQASDNNEWYPTRLIEVESVGNRYARLIITSERRPAGPYITLSHRWGSAAFLKLTADRLSKLKEDIPPSELPKCFIDAFSVARKLSVRYIWIDSLCIIQDSHVDWYYEASNMGRVYSHALCNLSATGASDTSEGLFLDQREPLLEPLQIQMSGEGGSSYLFVDSNYRNIHVSGTPLNRRGWVVQERLLARRVLHFGRHQLLFECFEKNACEQYPSGIPTILSSNFKNTLLQDESSSDYYSRTISAWHRVVEAYTSASFTFPSDKVIALSGLVSMFQTLRPHDSYLAGLWRSRLTTELAWNVMDCSQADGSASVVSATYRAPSWSWLKLDGRINTQYPDPDAPSLVSVIEAHVSPAVEGRDSTGEIGQGRIRLAGCLKRVRLVRNTGCPQPQWLMLVRAMAEEDKVAVGDEEMEAFVGADLAHPPPAPRSPTTSSPHPPPNKMKQEEKWLLVMMSSALLDAALPNVVMDEGLCALPLLGPTPAFPMVRGLILAHLPAYPWTNANYGQFFRIGMFFISGKEAVSFMLESDKLDRECPCEWYDENTEQHVFSVL